MTLSKLYKNGNSTVVAVPGWITELLNLKPGDSVEFFSPRGENYETSPFAIISKPIPHEKPKPPSKR